MADEADALDDSDNDTEPLDALEEDPAEETLEEDEIEIDLGLLSTVDELDIEDLVTVVPVQDREFTCQSCFLVVPEAIKAGDGICRDCA